VAKTAEPIWIQGKVGAPPEELSGPLVTGGNWLVEMLRNESRRSTIGFYWAPFAIVHKIPNLDVMWNSRFVGFSAPGKPPAEWLTVSMTFDLGDVPLARSPQEFAALLKKPLPFVLLEGEPVSPLSRKAKGLIASNYRANVAIAEIAIRLGVSHGHLTRQFKHDYGLTPIDYRHRLRVSDAMGRLSQGDDILDVGYEVGFNDTKRFYEDFRKVTGTSPGKCRL
jgi:AraC-like DNA-binding protein